MKINEINQLTTGAKTGKAKPGATGFKDLLDSRMNSVEGGARISPVGPTPPISPPPPLLRLESLTLTENTIDVLGSFGAALDDSAFSNDDLRPFISALEENAAALVDLRRQLNADDPLAGLLDKVAAVTCVETAKYNRGDYAI